MPCCCAVNCSNRDTRGYSLYRFPSDPLRREKWIQNCKRGNWTPTVGSRLCEEHFEDCMFENYLTDNGRKKLKPNAIPTLFPSPNPTKVAFNKLVREKRALKRRNRLKRKYETSMPTKVIVQEHSYNKINKEVNLQNEKQVLKETRRVWKELRLKSLQRTLQNAKRKLVQERRMKQKYRGVLARLCLQSLNTEMFGLNDKALCRKKQPLKNVNLLFYVERPTKEPSVKIRRTK